MRAPIRRVTSQSLILFSFQKRCFHFRFSKIESAVLCEIFIERNCRLLRDALNKAVRECSYSSYSQFKVPPFICKTEHLITMKKCEIVDDCIFLTGYVFALRFSFIVLGMTL
ncbi:hypothetical protein ACOME3_007884 [Neoechinorhynchus agilis]